MGYVSFLEGTFRAIHGFSKTTCCCAVSCSLQEWHLKNAFLGKFDPRLGVVGHKLYKNYKMKNLKGIFMKTQPHSLGSKFLNEQFVFLA